MAKFTPAGKAQFDAWFKRNLDPHLVSPAPIEFSVLETLQMQYDQGTTPRAVVHSLYTLNRVNNVEFVPGVGGVCYDDN